MKGIRLIMDSAEVELEREFLRPDQAQQYVKANELKEELNAQLEIEDTAYGLHFLLLSNPKDSTEYMGHVCMSDERLATDDSNDDQLNILYRCDRFIPSERAFVEIMIIDYANFVKQLRDARQPTIQ